MDYLCISGYWSILGRVGFFLRSSVRVGVLYPFGSGPPSDAVRVGIPLGLSQLLLLLQVGSVLPFGSGRVLLGSCFRSVFMLLFICSYPIRFRAPALIRLCVSDPIRPLRSDPSSSIRSDPSLASVAFLFATFPKCWVLIRSDSLLSSTYPIRAPLSDPIRTLHCFLKLFQQVFTPFDDVFDHSNY